MRRSTNNGMRIVERETIIAGIPGDARRVGLVGAAVTDHPDIAAIVRDIVDSGREIGITLPEAGRLVALGEVTADMTRGDHHALCNGPSLLPNIDSEAAMHQVDEIIARHWRSGKCRTGSPDLQTGARSPRGSWRRRY